MAKGYYRKTEHPAQPGRSQGESSDAARVARVMGRAESRHARGAKTTESPAFLLEPNQAKHCTGDYGQADGEFGQSNH